MDEDLPRLLHAIRTGDGSNLRYRAVLASVASKRSIHAWRKAVDGRVAARAGTAGAVGEKEQHAKSGYEWLREIVIAPVRCPPGVREVPAEGVRADSRRGVGGRDAGRERPQHRRRAVMDDVLSGRDGLIRHYSSPSERLRNCWSYPLLTVSGSSLTARRPSISSLCMRFLPWSLLSRVLP